MDMTVGFIRKSPQIESLLTVGAVLLLTLGVAGPALGSAFERTIERCRDRIGRPIVQACLGDRGKGGAHEACRVEASPKVMACVQKAIIARRGRGDIQQAREHCRQTVGRPIVQTCMRTGGNGAALEACRTQASPRVRACVRAGLIAAYGRTTFREAIEHCRLTVGRPIVQACLGGRRTGVEGSLDLEACRAKASPSVRACVQKRIRTRLSAHAAARRQT
jgi:hypothetical protein